MDELYGNVHPFPMVRGEAYSAPRFRQQAAGELRGTFAGRGVGVEVTFRIGPSPSVDNPEPMITQEQMAEVVAVVQGLLQETRDRLHAILATDASTSVN